MMKNLVIVCVPQEYKTANHKFLWHLLAQEKNVEVLILNISADLVVSVIKRRWYRLSETRSGLQKINQNLRVLRPIFFVRPEITPHVFDFCVRSALRAQIKRYFDPDEYSISFLIYNPYWARIVKGLFIKAQVKIFYYIIDELRLHANNDHKIAQNIHNDKYACLISDHIFVMSQVIKDNRIDFEEKITVIGNGALFKTGDKSIIKIPKSVGFIGNFRNWIDEDLLSNLIAYRQDLLFCFVGPVEKNMKPFMDTLLNNFQNTAYFGVASKEETYKYYQMFDVVIVPYRQNQFIRASRPIKIVESIFAGTPVVSIPISGYTENDYIKFATDYVDFSNKINCLEKSPINVDTSQFHNFVIDNSWEKISSIFIKYIKKP
jgi:glycosyltransferase involved in cell wall biosynthesis